MRNKNQEYDIQVAQDNLDDTFLQNKAEAGMQFLEVVSEQENDATSKGTFEAQLQRMRRQANFSDNDEIKAAQSAAIEFLLKQNCEKQDTELGKTSCYKQFGLINQTAEAQPTWGIYNYFYNDGRCDYLASNTLDEGQQQYRDRTEDQAKIFIAGGNVQR